VAKNDIAGAITVLDTNLNAATTREGRTRLFDSATRSDATGERYFDQAFFEKQIDAVVADRPPSQNGMAPPNANRVGRWLMDVTKHCPPEVASAILDAVKARYKLSWLEQPMSGRRSVSPMLFSGLSQAVDAADQPVLARTGTNRATEIAKWLTE